MVADGREAVDQTSPGGAVRKPAAILSYCAKRGGADCTGATGRRLIIPRPDPEISTEVVDWKLGVREENS
ncbi:Hypp6303 [Branchiostoma lanceolatum]|uniref:Hypp6303 protein n=1 Tax=Branchiostoma lanceolatum TaxID=7740 RepID=A0A8K0E3C2_BRALA|nr:Hypp6303 [Branchiostoma lanceolatum]